MSTDFSAHKRSTYLQMRTTNLSVIMSASLALLAYHVFQSPNGVDFGEEVARALASFIVIIWVTMEYVAYSMVQDRYPSWTDTIQLHLLGVAQIACSVYVGDFTNWIRSSVFMAVIGVWAYVSQRPEKRGDLIYPDIRETVLTNLKIALACCGGSMMTLFVYYKGYFSTSVLLTILGVDVTMHEIALVGPYVLICYMLAKNTYRVTRKIDSITGLDASKA